MSKIIIIPPFEVTAEMEELLVPGTVVCLNHRPDNPVDPNAVSAVFRETGAPCGYLANSEKTVKPGISSATHIKKMLDKPEVSGANARLLYSFEYKTKKADGTVCTQNHWVAEVYPQPIWKKEDSAAAAFELVVKGTATMNAEKAQVIADFDTLGKNDLVLVPMDMQNGETKYTVWRRTSVGTKAGQPAGEVKDLPPEITLALGKLGMLPVTPVCVVNSTSYKVSVELNSSALDDFNAEMEEAVKSCILQVRDVKERVTYMLSQAVPDTIIRGVLNNLRVQDPGKVIKCPRQRFLQTGDNDYLTRALGYHLAGKNIRLVGEKGSGKNTLVSTVCWLFNQTVCRVQGNSDLDKVDLLGGQGLKNGSTFFELSSFAKALQTGGDVVLDEINAVKPEIAIVLHSLTDDARSVEVPGYGLVVVHPNSRIWATMNEMYVGTGELNSATADRFTPLLLADQMDMAGLLKAMFPNAKTSDINACDNLYKKVKKAVQDGKCSPDAITTRGYIDAMESAQWLPIRAALLDNVANRPQDVDDRNVIADYIRAAFPA